MIFVDTSAFFALVDPRDEFHSVARGKLESLLESKQELATHNYILSEAYSLLHRRVSFEASRQLYREVYQLCRILWVSQGQHERASKSYINQRSRRFSFVDCVSFELMQSHGIKRYFGFDADFRHAGFESA